MSQGQSCRCPGYRVPGPPLPSWRVLVRQGNYFDYAGHRFTPEDWKALIRSGNYSIVEGYRFSPSDYSSLVCLACLAIWRTDAEYVAEVPDISDLERRRL